MVFCIFALSTLPVSVRVRPVAPSCCVPALPFVALLMIARLLLLLRLRSAALLAHHGLYARDAAAHLGELIRLGRLTRRQRHTQVELFPAQIEQFLLQICGRLLSQFFRAHRVNLPEPVALRTGCPPTTSRPPAGKPRAPLARSHPPSRIAPCRA